jgi:hypothetical protein
MTIVPDPASGSHPNPFLSAALDYAARGWSVLPLYLPDTPGPGAGKRPCIKWEKFQETCPTEAELRLWWNRWPTANVGGAFGPVSGLVGLDIDGQAGEELLAELSGGDLPPTLEFKTGRGRRLLYQWPDEPLAIRSFPHNGKEAVRILAHGSQTVMPPSVHPSKEEYTWVQGHRPGEIEPAPAPVWLKSRLGPDRDAKPTQDADHGAVGTDGASLALCSPERRRRARTYLRECNPAISGQGGHNQTFKVAVKLVKGFNLDTETAFQLLWEDYNRRCLPPWSEKELRHKVQEAAKADNPPGFLLGPPPASPSADGQATEPGVDGQPEPRPNHPFPEPVPLDQLQDAEPDADWLWTGLLARRAFTLFSASGAMPA